MTMLTCHQLADAIKTIRNWREQCPTQVVLVILVLQDWSGDCDETWEFVYWDCCERNALLDDAEALAPVAFFEDALFGWVDPRDIQLFPNRAAAVAALHDAGGALLVPVDHLNDVADGGRV